MHLTNEYIVTGFVFVFICMFLAGLGLIAMGRALLRMEKDLGELKMRCHDLNMRLELGAADDE